MAIAALARASMIGLVVFALSVSMPAAQQAGQGETWEHTIQVTAMGMSMPARTVTSCQAKGAERAAPQMPDESCTVIEAQLAGSRMTFKVTCTQPEPMTGTGEMTWNGQNSYSGTMTMTSPDGTMAMKTAGRRLGAACDPGAEERGIAALVDKGNALADKFAAMQEAEIAKVCAQQAIGGHPAYFSGAPPVCADSALFCRNFRTEAGFAKTGALGDASIEQAGAVCKVSPATLRADLCGAALKNESLVFLGSSCAEESKVLVQRECAGRKFTSDVSAKYRSFCAASFAARLAADGAETEPASTTAKPAPTTPADVKGGAVEGARRRLGGLIRK